MNPSTIAKSLDDAKLSLRAAARFISIIAACAQSAKISDDLRNDLAISAYRDLELKQKIETLSHILLATDDPSFDLPTIRAGLAQITLDLVEKMETNQRQLSNLLSLLHDAIDTKSET